MDNGSSPRQLPVYRYSDLKDPLNIRILVLTPADESVTTVDCELQEWTFQTLSSSNRQYEALSWCWGQSRGETRQVRITTEEGVKRFEVPDHLYEGLLALRYTDKKRYLWIDGLCIHQSKAEERDQQVPRMKDIYGKASNVCVWLGQSTERTELAFAFVRDKLLKLWDFDNLCKNPDSAESWTALLELMKRPWFSRRWIVQEISLAQRGTVYCGASTMDWQEFADAVSLFVQIEETPAKLSELLRKMEKYNFDTNFFEEVPFLGATLLVKTTKDIFQRSASGGHYKQLSLESLVSRLAIFKTSEPRDTVYGLLAMARDSEPYANAHQDLSGLTAAQKWLLFRIANYFPKPLKSRYEVSYKSQVIDVYQEFIAFSIRNAKTPLQALDIICRPFAQSYTREQDFSFDRQRLDQFTEEERKQTVTLPSWVPNIKDLPFDMQPKINAETSDGSNFFDLRMTRVGGDSLVGPPDVKTYNATGEIPYSKGKLTFKKRPNLENTPYSMFAEGFVLDTISRKEERAQGGNIPLTWLERVGWTNRQQDPPDEHKWDAFWRTLVGNRDHKGGDPPIYFQRACKEIFRQLVGESQNIFYTSTWISNPLTPTPITGFLRRVQSVIWGRCMIETRDGRLGLASHAVLENDLICILFGCSVPVVLRRVPKTDSELRREEEDERLADQEFRAHAAKALKKVLIRRKTARNFRNRAVPSRWKRLRENVVAVRVWQRIYELRNVGRAAIIMLLAMWIFMREQVLTAVLLALLGAWYFSSLSTHRFVEPSLNAWTAIEAGATLLVVFVGSAVLQPYGRGLMWEVRILSCLLIGIFPSTLHLPVRPLFIRVRDYYEKALDDIETSQARGISNLTSLHWRMFKQLLALLALLFARGRPPPIPPTPDRPRPLYYYRLIGECYIHGMMDGEAIEWHYQNKVGPEMFEMR